MPTVLRRGPYRLFFYSSDGGEPPHVHIERESNVAKFWLSPVRLVASGGFRRPELRDMERIVIDEQQTLLEAWHDVFGG